MNQAGSQDNFYPPDAFATFILMHKLLLLKSLLFCFQCLAAQIPPLVSVTKYNEGNGLVQGHPTAMLQSKDGYLWIGTTNGLTRFDGYTFRSFNSPSIPNSITHLTTDSAGLIWMSFLGGSLGRFDPADGSVKHFPVQLPADTSSTGGEIESLLIDKAGRLWMSVTRRGLVLAEPEKNKYTFFNIISDTDRRYVPAFKAIYNTVNSIAQGNGDTLWLATHDGLYLFNTTTRKVSAIRKPNSESENPRTDLFRSIVVQGDTIWLGAWSGGLSRYIISQDSWKTWLPSLIEEIPSINNIITSVVPRNDAELWIGSPDKGLGIFDKQKESFYFLSNNRLFRNIPEGEWYTLIKDKEDNVWALQQDGLAKVEVPDYFFKYHPFSFTKARGTNRFDLNDWFEDDDYKLVATGFAEGIYVWNKRTQQSYTLAPATLPGEEVNYQVEQFLQDKSGTIWIVTRDILYQFDRKTGRLKLPKQPPPYSKDKRSNILSRISEDAEGNIWIMTRRNGIFVWMRQSDSFIHYSTNEKGDLNISNNFLMATAADKQGRIWVGSSFGMLGYATKAGKKIKMLNADSAHIPGTQTYLLYADKKGDMWAGTFYGLCLFDCEKTEPTLKKIYKASQGLRSNLVRGMQQDNSGLVWCVTEAAVCSINPKDDHVITYDVSDGLNTKMGINIVSAGKDSMRLLDYGGYYTFAVNRSQKPIPTAPLAITRMMVNDIDFNYRHLFAKANEIVLDPDQNTFSFEFAVVNFNRPSHQRYQYMLEGLDKQWIDAQGRRFISYSNIPGGHYTFRVRAADEANPDVQSEVALKLYLKTPFYKTYWFIALVVLALAGLLYLLYRNRLAHHRQLHRLQSKTQLLEKEKALVMYDALKQHLNPHFLFNSLSSLSSLIHTDKQLADKFLGHLSFIYRYILKNRDRETISVQDEIRFVKQYIELQKTRFKSGLQVHIDVPEESLQAQLTPVVLQNLVENAIKHNSTDPDSPLVIRISVEEDYLVVSNNLQRKEFVETSNKQGLQNLRALYAYYTNKPVIQAEDQDTFTIKLPLL